MWRKSDVKINFKHFKNYFLLPTSVATQRFGLVLLRRCRESSEFAGCCVATQRLGPILLRRVRCCQTSRKLLLRYVEMLTNFGSHL